jgi:hypothetical protein
LEGVKEFAEFGGHGTRWKTGWKMRYTNVHTMIARHPKLALCGIENRLFKEKHAALSCEPRHQMLWTLKYEIPT